MILIKKSNNKDSKFQVVILLEYLNTKRYLLKYTVETGLNKNFKNFVPWSYVIGDLNHEEIVGMFYKKNCKQQNKKNLE